MRIPITVGRICLHIREGRPGKGVQLLGLLLIKHKNRKVMSSSFVAQHKLYKAMMSNGDCEGYMRRIKIYKTPRYAVLHRCNERVQPLSSISITFGRSRYETKHFQKDFYYSSVCLLNFRRVAPLKGNIENPTILLN